MEVRGTIHSIRQWEQLFIQSMPYIIIHDGHFEPDEFDPTKSASKIPAQSEVYTRKYKLFPFGKKQLWEERARVTFCYDERHGTGTMKISDRGMHIISVKIKSQFAVVQVKRTEIQLANGVEVKPD